MTKCRLLFTEQLNRHCVCVCGGGGHVWPSGGHDVSLKCQILFYVADSALHVPQQWKVLGLIYSRTDLI